MKYLSNAKINLNLMITGIDDKGYHLLYSVVAPIDLYDEIEIELTEDNKITLTCDDKKIPTDDKNIIIKCIKELKKVKDFSNGLKINLTKRIPTEAGLGGGSSNGATVLKGLNEMLNLGLSNEELVEIGAKVGADIPFFIYNHLSLMEGYGEKITLIDKKDFNPYIVLAKPDGGINTKEAFYLYDNMIKTKEYTPFVLHKIISCNNKKEIGELIKNDLQRIANTKVPEIEKISKIMVEFGAEGSCMSGSGSSVFGLFYEKDKAIKAMQELQKEYNFVKITKIL